MILHYHIFYLAENSSYITDFSSIKPLPQAHSDRVAEILASVGHQTAREFDRAEGGEPYQQEAPVSAGASWETMNTGKVPVAAIYYHYVKYCHGNCLLNKQRLQEMHLYCHFFVGTQYKWTTSVLLTLMFF